MSELAPEDLYERPAEPCEYEERIQKSRFLALVFPVNSHEAAQGILAELKRTHYKATHHCSAWRLAADPEDFHYSDDGEPSGTAGQPILRAIQGANLLETMVVVIRWYGGVKLGTGGLTRAYGGTAQTALDLVSREQVVIRTTLELVFEYSAMTLIKRLVAKYHAMEYALDCTTNVHMRIGVPASKVGSMRAELLEVMQGRGEVR